MTADGDAGTRARQERMAILAQATESELAGALKAFEPLPGWRYARRPEVGLVMVRGRVGGDGGAFNIGEATATRCVVALVDEDVRGFGYLLGRSPRRAQMAALLDALAQRPGQGEALERCALAPIRSRLEAEAETMRAQTAATKVAFFTVANGR